MKTKPILSAPVTHCGDQTQNDSIYRKRFGLALGGFLFTSIFALIAPPVKAQCPQWDASGQWTIYQPDLRAPVALIQNGKTVSGTASSVTKRGGVVHGQVSGVVDHNNFQVEITWSSGAVGVYRGTIDQSGGIIDGTTYDNTNPSSTAQWHTYVHFKCAEAAPAQSSGRPSGPFGKIADEVKASAKATPKPIARSGKYRPDTTPTPTPSAQADESASTADESSSDDTQDQHKKKNKKKKKHHHHHDDDDQNQGND